MAAITICSDFGAPKNKVWHCFHCLRSLQLLHPEVKHIYFYWESKLCTAQEWGSPFLHVFWGCCLKVSFLARLVSFLVTWLDREGFSSYFWFFFFLFVCMLVFQVYQLFQYAIWNKRAKKENSGSSQPCPSLCQSPYLPVTFSHFQCLSS